MKHRSLTAFFTILFLVVAIPVQAGVYSHIKTGSINYASGYYPANLANTILNWQKDKIDYYIGGERGPVVSSALWPVYVDHAAIYPDQMPALIDSANENGYNYEDTLLHIRLDYEAKALDAGQIYNWTGMDQFDAFEKTSDGGGNYLAAVNGAFLLNGSAYTDISVHAYDGIHSLTITDKLLLGYTEPFAEINFNVSKAAGAGTLVSWDYWNGSSYVPLTLSQDSTSGLKSSGKITFTPPADWQRKSENGSRSKYWVRATVSDAGSKPIVTKIYGDNWRPSSPFNGRGWDSNAAGRVNVGLGNLEYNPNPPANATAKFRYQARTLGLWADNLFFGNPGNIQNGQRTWAKFLAEYALAKADKVSATGVMYDDGGASPNIPNPSNYLTYTEFGSGSWHASKVLQYRDETDYLHMMRPTFQVGTNSWTMEFIYGGDFAIIENSLPSYQAGSTPFNYINPTVGYSFSFDGFLPQYNPRGTKGGVMAQDTYTNGFMEGTNWYPWDRGNRGPMISLATYYIGANANTFFIYNSLGWRYPTTDEYYYFTAPTQSTSAVQPGSTYVEGNFSNYPNSGIVKLGNTGETPNFTKISNGRLQFSDAVYGNYPIGSKITYVKEGHQSTDPIPSFADVYKWANWFPAIGVNIGQPDPNGWNGGARGIWKTGPQVAALTPEVCHSYSRWSECAGVTRRDFTNGIVLARLGVDSTPTADKYTYSKPIELDRMYYLLYADGTTSSGITSIQLRANEGAILLKSPTTSGGGAVSDLVPPNISSVAVSGITTTSATIGWVTDEEADSQIDYGLTTAYGQSSPLSSVLLAAHTISLSGLTPNTVYHYRVKSRDAAGNLSVSGGGTFNTSATIVAQSGQWYGSSGEGIWAHRKKITLDKTKVSGLLALVDFPVLVSLSIEGGPGAKVKTDGSDIVFTDGAGTKVAHEIESFDSASGQLLAWVKVPLISPSSDTVLYMYYGNAAASDQQNKSGTWPESYKGVWHLDSGNSASQLPDSSSFALHAAINGNVSKVAAKLGDGVSVSGGSGSFISAPASVYGNTPVTLSLWVKTSGFGNSGETSLISKESYGAGTGYALIDNGYNNSVVLFRYGGAGPSASINRSLVNDGNWHYLVGVSNNDGAKVYLDGSLVQSSGASYGSKNNSTEALTIGRWTSSAGGVLDEARISNMARSADWILTEYNNQSNPSTFMTVASTEDYSAPDAGGNNQNPPANNPPPPPTPTPPWSGGGNPNPTPPPSVSSSGGSSGGRSSGGGGSSSNASLQNQGVSDLKSRIASLLKQVADLQAILKARGASGSFVSSIVSSSGKTFSARNLSFGSKNEDVRTLQTILVQKGYLPANHEVTNYFGPLTRAALRKFQCDQGVVCSGNEYSTGFGVLGPKTRNLLLK